MIMFIMLQSVLVYIIQKTQKSVLKDIYKEVLERI